MASTADSEPPTQVELKPCLINLSSVFLEERFSDTELGVNVSFLPTFTTLAVKFRAIVQHSSSQCFMLESFYDDHMLHRTFKTPQAKLQVKKATLASAGISHCHFSSETGRRRGEPQMNDQFTPQLNVGGIGRVPIIIQGHSFITSFFLVKPLFSQKRYKSKFVAVLGADFIHNNFVQAQWTRVGWDLKLPPIISVYLEKLVIFIDGCCLAGGQAGSVARAGYGIHFSNLPLDSPTGWDIGAPLSERGEHTNQRAELMAVIRTIQLVRARNVSCEHIEIFTTSKYAVQGLEEWIPKWRVSGYRTSRKNEVKNADLFKDLDMQVSTMKAEGVEVSLAIVSRQENKEAIALSRSGATQSRPWKRVHRYPKDSKGNRKLDSPPELLIARDLLDEMKPLAQWTPDGDGWISWIEPANGLVF